MGQIDALFSVAMPVVIVTYLVEFLGTTVFWPWVFDVGICACRETRTLPRPSNALGSEVETENGKFRLVVADVMLFRRKYHWFQADFRTPFPLKGIVRWTGSDATVEGRVPVSTTAFMAIWLLGWVLSGLAAVAQSATGGLAVLLFGCIFTIALCGFSIWFEIRRLRKTLDEYEGAPSPARADATPSDLDPAIEEDSFDSWNSGSA